MIQEGAKPLKAEALAVNEDYTNHPAYQNYTDRLDRLHLIADERQWSLEDFKDLLAIDAQSYEELDPHEKDAFLFMLSHRLKAERMVSDLLDVFIAAIPEPDAATRTMMERQKAEEEKHAQGVIEYYANVIGEDRLEEILFSADTHSDPVSELLYSDLNASIERLRQEPTLYNLISGFMSYHQLAEGDIAYVFSKMTIKKIKHDAVDAFENRHVRPGEPPQTVHDYIEYPGFLAGHFKVMQDESRHIAFGMEFLRMQYAVNKELTQTAVLETSLNFKKRIDELHDLAVSANLEPFTREAYGKGPAEIHQAVDTALNLRLKRIDSELQQAYVEALAIPANGLF